ncbi:pyrroloquinoline quinone biosynthesis peptide chaperone PqqD [Streptacidiphilus pinicola]|uniref:Pyrroloquinoline quinone biosynthesis peptide chaperone PqqD n=1 Tax=Streptacidiphilus pinicola TaxID=2219663 RepID=A0A2X0IMI1_9ACTN|nr:pyrroloquinoline quinone biosynthesis peptide chaperone PqqD [Streptacidiphilus pinicola]RAG85877.1 pyrroloquinoline quinone biosynthesis peptide chaperone PqqD [Streptacidiphilus pinicola]
MGPAPAPRLGPGVRFTHDAARAADLLLLPEKVLVLNTTAAAVLALCDGSRGLDEITAALKDRYEHVNRQDVIDLLARLEQHRAVAHG